MMVPEELIEEFRQRADQLTDEQLEDIKNYFIQIHAVRNQSQTAMATEKIISGMEQIFSQLDPQTVQLLKKHIQG